MPRTRRPARRSGRKVALDVETTGLSAARGHRVIEIGCAEIVDREITGRVFQRYVDPERDIERGAFQVHGISRERLRGKPKFAEVLDELLEFVRDAEVLIHNAKFDLSFLDAELRRAGCAQSFRSCCRKVTDTLSMARRMFPGSGRSLDNLCYQLGVDRSGRDLHGALLDARLLAQVYLRMTGGESDSAPRTASASPAKETTVQLTYAKATGAIENAHPPTAEELYALYLEFVEKVREEKPWLSPHRIQNIAVARAKRTIKEIAEAGIGLLPAAGAWERCEQLVKGGGKRSRGPRSGAAVRRTASYARTLVRRTKSRK